MVGGQRGWTAGGHRPWQLVRGAWSLLVLVQVALAGSIAAPLWAQTGPVHTRVGGGLRLTVDTKWPDGAGYRPVRVTVTPTAPVTANRTLVFEFTTKSTGWQANEEMVVTQEIELPAGSRTVSATIAVPYLGGHDGYEYEVGEGGFHIMGLEGGGNFQQNSTDESIPRVLVVADHAVSALGLGRAVVATPYLQSSGGTYYLPTYQALSSQDLPSRWVDYSALDMVCISFGDLRALKSDRPRAFEALLAWTAAGGNLIVFDMGTDRERRVALERLVGASPEEGQGTEWQSPNPNEFGKRVEGVSENVVAPYEDVPEVEYGMAEGYGSGMAVKEAPEKPKEQKKSPQKRPTPSSFASRPYEMGMLVAVACSAPWDEDAGFWAWLCNHLTSSRIVWSKRHGLSLVSGNPEFFRFLIPGVGNPPLNAFRVLITLFVLAIGPVNYYLLRHFRRLQLLVVTVPLSAAGVTLALFAYAVFSDGLGTRIRVRSVTQINQKTGQTECWARLSYYSGLAPGNGLVFSDDVVVYPFEAGMGEQAVRRRELLWYEGQRLTTGWLRSRTPTQFLTVRSRQSEQGIDVGTADGGVLPITNRLGTEIELLVVCDAAGEFYWAQDVAEEGRSEAEPVDADDATAELKARVEACDISYPPGAGYGVYGGATTSTSLMEGLISDLTTETGSTKDLQAKSYVAVVRFSPEVELGLSGATPEASFHVVVGEW